MSTSQGQRIRAARRARGWTQSELAAEIKVTQRAVSAWERGALVSPSHASQLEELLQVTIDQRGEAGNRRIRRVGNTGVTVLLDAGEVDALDALKAALGLTSRAATVRRLVADRHKVLLGQ